MGIDGMTGQDKFGRGDNATDQIQQTAAEAKQKLAQEQAAEDRHGSDSAGQPPGDSDDGPDEGGPKQPQDFRGH
ncbi:hypothetical protein [Zhihengliuella sp.]|uniref:hypothetical protein n=1 Tax=Zhihengliuella sp. TaxID=1954483 RepID=UPI002810E8A2|nr:hypothetical protein [Zhihengliuella sp.]